MAKYRKKPVVIDVAVNERKRGSWYSSLIDPEYTVHIVDGDVLLRDCNTRR